MAKKKTRVMLPGGIQGLVHDLQNGTSKYAQRPIVEEVDNEDDNEKKEDSSDDSKKTTEQGRGVEAKPNGGNADERQTADKNAGQPTSATERVRTEVTPVDTTSTARPAKSTPMNEDEDQAVTVPSSSSKTEDAAAGKPAMREYHIVKDDSKDSWDLFIDMARQYKSGGGKLATIYIDETLKSVLDRMKYAGSEKLSTSAILSSIVARFIYDHEDEIRKVLFSGDLL
ncbi:MAG: hypothetical protein ACOYJK_09285 [Prevotella sp.]|jgi:hypothetical protein